MRVAFALVGFIALTFLAPLAGSGSPPGEWYRVLAKPAWNPPAWIFGPVWTFLYVTIGVAAWGVWKRAGWHRAHMFWAVQLALNAAWTPVFFGLHQIGGALAVIVLLWCAIAATLAAFARVEPWSGWLLAPYLAWVSFATWLNFTLWRLNA